MNEQGINIKKSKVIGLIALILLITIPLIYFFAWRPADSNYEEASKQALVLKNEAMKVNEGIDPIEYPGFIDNTTPSALESTARSYNTALTSLSDSPVVTRDLAIANHYKQHKNDLFEYGKQLANLAESTKQYVAILSACDKLSQLFGDITTVEKFDSESKDCVAAVEKSVDSPNKAFNDQFLDEYRSLVSELLNHYRDSVQAENSSALDIAASMIKQTREKITDLGSKQIDYSLPNVSEALEKLSSLIDSQKSAFIR